MGERERRGDWTFEFLDLIFDAGESLVGRFFGVESFLELGLEFFVVGMVDFFFFGGWSCGHGSGGGWSNKSDAECGVKVNIYVIFGASNLQN